jgi:hypothetical protein
LSVVIALSGTAALAQGAAPAPKAAQAKPHTQLPAAVSAAFKKAYPDAVIKNVSHETEDGQEQYEIESQNAGLSLDVNYKPDGTLLVVEEGVAEADVPPAVRAAITKRYPKAVMKTRERVTEKGQTSYEIGLTSAPVKSVQLRPDGTWIVPKAPK